MFFKITGGNADAKADIDVSEENGIVTAELNIVFAAKQIPETFSVSWKFPAVDCYSTWSPSIRDDHSIQPNWASRRTASELARWMPLHGIISSGGNNRMMIAVSDVIHPIEIETGINEFDSELDCCVRFFTRPVSPIKDYRAVIRIDLREIPFYDSVRQAAEWWEKDCGYASAYVPECAREPMNSLWYSYHHALDPDTIVRQCRLSREYGLKTVIVDDGWQMAESADVSGVYEYCGDWQPSENKIPDMREFVDRVHETRMKAILWFSVPFIGIKSKNYERFKGMLLENSGDGSTFFALDPRYACVRSYLTDLYVKAVGEWGFDGLKLDFIDSFVASGKSLQASPECDLNTVEEAVTALLEEVTEKLRAINPEVMIEFRQSYIGPAIRKYGNILRVGDCPIDAIKNRQDIVSMRLTSGKTAVHSDMLAWNYGDTVISAACQIASAIFSVPQISVRLDELPEEHRRMLKFYLDFWYEHKDVLLDGLLTAENPECNYSLVRSELGGRCVAVVYADSVLKCSCDYTAAVNITKQDGILLEGFKDKKYEIVNCMGGELDRGTVGSDIVRLSVPVSGIVFIG